MTTAIGLRTKLDDTPTAVAFFVYATRTVVRMSAVDARQSEEMGIGSRRMPDIEVTAPSGETKLVCEGEVSAWENKGWRRAKRPSAPEARAKVPFGQVDWSRYSDDELLAFCAERNIIAEPMNREQRVGVLRRIGYRPSDADTAFRITPGSSVIPQAPEAAPCESGDEAPGEGKLATSARGGGRKGSDA